MVIKIVIIIQLRQMRRAQRELCFYYRITRFLFDMGGIGTLFQIGFYFLQLFW